MDAQDRMTALDRHALVMAVWLALGFVAAVLFHYGFGAGGAPFILSGFVVVLGAFAGHVILNAVYRATFTSRELALGLVLYAVALVTFGLATLVSPTVATHFLPLSLGFVTLFAVVVFYLVVHFGARRAFDAFDAIRAFRRAGGDGTR